ncbi:MAG TPA: mevalonate kinase [Polyangia bacterium]|nr:mevalonate kinase [Polyangia bacterium]
MSRGFGHGKVILVGEHAVVYGHAALAAGVSVGISAEATPGEGRLRVPAWSLDARAGDGSDVGRALEALLDVIGERALDFAVDAKIPARAGLGSSAALAVAVARAAVAASSSTKSEASIADAVMAAERVFHGAPSGIDAAAATSGAVGRFTRAEGWRPVPVLQTMTVCVGLSGKPRNTAAQVAAVASLRDRLPAVDGILSIMGGLAGEAATMLARGDVDGLGRIFDAAHGLLAALRLSSPELDTLVHAARAAGAVGAKLTGAGGGGAVIALAPGHERDVLRRWREAGFDGFLAEIAATRPETARPEAR